MITNDELREIQSNHLAHANVREMATELLASRASAAGVSEAKVDAASIAFNASMDAEATERGNLFRAAIRAALEASA